MVSGPGRTTLHQAFLIWKYAIFKIILVSLLLTPFWQSYAQDLEQLQNQKKLELNGGIDARVIFYDANGIQPRYLPFNYLITGTPVISIYGIQIPIYFSLSRQQNSFTQPFNQFGLSPKYKSLTLHAGYRNLHYSPFTLAGHTFLGGGFDWQPSKWRISAMAGRFNKATVLDTLQGIYIENFNYRRTGYAVRVGYGTRENYFDLITLHARDHESSSTASTEWLDSLKITPAENLVTGYQAKFSFLKNKLFFESDGALSLYTTDRRIGEIGDSSIIDKVKPFRNFTNVNYSSELYAAFAASLSYKLKQLTLKLQYRYVEPNYKSMGSYFLNNDLENLTINPSLFLANGRVRFTGSLGLQRDNLQDLKRATSKRVIGAANFSAEFSENFGIDLSYTNFSNTQRARTIRFADSLRIAQTTQNLSISPRFIKTSGLHSHSVIVSANFNQFDEFNDQRSLAVTGNDIKTQTYFATYQIGFLSSRSSLYASLNYARLGNEMIKDMNSGITLGGTKSLLSNKLAISLSSGYILSERNGEKGKILNESLQARYGIDKHNTINLMTVFLGNYPDAPSELVRRYQEIRIELGYGYNF